MIYQQDHALPIEVALGHLMVERGCLILASNNIFKAGDIVEGYLSRNKVDQPFYIIAQSNRDEFLSWCQRLDELTGKSPSPQAHRRYYYRVATD